MKIKVLIFILFFLASFIKEAASDTIHLVNGRSIEGLIEKENEESVELDVGFGTVKFRMEEIESIERSRPDEAPLMRQKWQREKKLDEERRVAREKELEAARREKEFEPKEVGFSQEAGHIVVDTLLNKKTKASLLLDTGASSILLSNRIAKRLKIKDQEEEIIKVKMADGREVDARFIILDTVSVEGVKAKDVEAVVLLDDTQMGDRDGLLGMSFLNKFNFQIDTVNKKLILKKRRDRSK
ncbi:TIGR02281 family clan AA aspartic protease [Candidatus Omnitrophota bacterium]